MKNSMAQLQRILNPVGNSTVSTAENLGPGGVNLKICKKAIPTDVDVKHADQPPHGQTNTQTIPLVMRQTGKDDPHLDIWGVVMQ